MSISEARILVRRGIKNPSQIPRYLRTGIKKKRLDITYELYRHRNGIPRQKRQIHELLQQDEFVLVILDACRYDIFEEEYQDHLSGELNRCWSEANLTEKWMTNTWYDTYDLTYISTSPYTSDYVHENRGTGFKPSETFGEIIDVIGQEWNPVLSTTPPESVTDIALQQFSRTDEIRTVVHYMQPHQPYIGDTKILQWDITDEKIEQLLEYIGKDLEDASIDPEQDEITVEELAKNNIDYHQERDLKRKNYKDIDKQLREGDITHEELKRAYRDNLKLVLPEVKRLVEHVDCPVIVSADHGEHLGRHLDELSQYHHPDRTHPVLREVPWLRVSDTIKGKQNLEDPDLKSEYTLDDKSAATETEVEDRLEALGYK